MEVAYAMAILPIEYMEQHKNLLGLRPLHYDLVIYFILHTIDTKFDMEARFFYGRREDERAAAAAAAAKITGSQWVGSAQEL